jgi:S-formylglutathione hydrolase FrmB
MFSCREILSAFSVASERLDPRKGIGRPSLCFAQDLKPENRELSAMGYLSGGLRLIGFPHHAKHSGEPTSTMIVLPMRSGRFLRSRITSLCAIALLLAACNGKKEEAQPDRPRLTTNVAMRDVTFHRAGLNRDMQYRVILPAAIAAGAKLPVVYLLHDGGGNFHDWSNYSGAATFAERGLILVMPEGDESYYTNAAERSQDRYEDYITDDLIADVESKFPVHAGRANRAIIGVSMGGYGAVKLALSHPDLFVFAGGIGPAIDVPSRPFSIRRIQQWRHYRSIFGPWGSQTRQNGDPFVLARSADPARTPYLFLTCGEQEGLLPANRNFAALLENRHFRYEFHLVPGGHDWNQWDKRLSSVFQSLSEHMASN